jgi:Undecaprenyl-phosphate glucose phosphotransferase
MPGVAEPPEIAVTITDAGSGLMEAEENRRARFTPRARLAGRTARLIGLDAAVTAGSAMLCFGLFNPVREITSSPVVVPMACLTVCLILSFFERGLYDPAEVMSRRVAWRKVVLGWLQAVAVGTLLTFCVAAVAGPWAAKFAHPGLERMGATLRGPWLLVFLLSGFAVIACARSLRLRFHAGPEPLNRTVIVGAGEQIQDLLSKIRSGGRRTFDVIGVVEPAGKPIAQNLVPGLPHFGDIDVLEYMIRQDAVDTVLVALPWSAGEETRAIIERVSMAPVDVYIYPGMNGLNLPLRRADRAFELPLLMASTRPIGGGAALIKRAEDLALSCVLLIFISPVMLGIAAIIKLTSKGPIFFRQRRLGYNNRVIEILKFRSMYTHLADANASQQAFRGDKRVTPIGAWLRRSSLDELPQLLNVLKGDMSLVGPRPHALATTAGGLTLEEAVPVYSSRHRVKPGITGWAQVNGYRGALDSVDKIVHRVNHDLYYIENWSLGFDLKILWRTARLVFADDNAF